ncbi:hypothetical protein Lqui_2431 [Legionella quinlivanii]|uniref:Uncharacterized protein n=2 Tax=Legionella quinlivanii TaxID=45073 RepID=A0A0W0XRX3_9GAMM|nr:hypothetical protein [Legionella quinlivanii]KTD47505.1 hypothetical protein Lqui_2431 [Legionella quinlivanii]SEG51092.1 hypothetical protein SAMN02746093_03191 [Legionella quinlivanii DSM 21216]STY49808.1 Uncharacterised protein [Legionella quinlivanii]
MHSGIKSKVLMERISVKKWEIQIEQKLFYSLRAMLDGVEAGEITMGYVDKWLAHRGYRLNWENYDLEKVLTH